MSRKSLRASGAILWLISIAATSVLCWSAASRLYQTDDPTFALAINPLNTEARVNLLIGELNADAPDLAVAQISAEQLVRQAPADARGYSLLGAVHERRGDVAQAVALYEAALTHSKTEIHALLSLADRALEQHDAISALYYVDLILRRWPEEVPQAFGIIVAAAGDQAGRPALVEKLGELPPWRSRAIRELLKDRNGLLLVQELLTGEGPTDAGPRRAEINATVAALAEGEAIRAAQVLFLATLPPAERARAGYVNDGTFQGPTGGYFGWQAKSNGASEVMLPMPGGGLGIRFRDTPARLGNVTQRLALPTGHYRIGADTTTRGLTAPKRLYWRISCEQGGKSLGELLVPEQSNGRQILHTEFEVPADSCSVQRLSLETDARTDSWRDRYKGEATFHALYVSRL